MKNLRNIEFWSALTIILVTILLIIGTYFKWFFANFIVGPFRFTHWLSIMGTFLIAVITPMFYILRRRYPKRNISLTRIHVFSNLFAFTLISIHFAQQMSRSVHPEDRTGLTLYIIVSILIASGFLHRFQILEKGGVYPPHRNRFLHVSITTAFYLIVIIHILHNLGFL
ncbi:MAG: hypothetical protein QG670_2520 [Thermoproteota archaeon]|nr:hypothetical protein [Thermoproteota archaeon]